MSLRHLVVASAALVAVAGSWVAPARACSIALAPPVQIIGDVTIPKDFGIFVNVARTHGGDPARPGDVLARIELVVTSSGTPIAGSLVFVETLGLTTTEADVFVWKPASGALPVGPLTVSFNEANEGAPRRPGSVNLTVEDRLLADPQPPVGPSIRSAVIERTDSTRACENVAPISSCGPANLTPIPSFLGIRRVIDVDPPDANAKIQQTTTVPYFVTTATTELRDASGKVLETLQGYGRFEGYGATVCVTERHVLRTDPGRVVEHPPACTATTGLSFAITSADLDEHTKKLTRTCPATVTPTIAEGVAKENAPPAGPASGPSPESQDGGCSAATGTTSSGGPGLLLALALVLGRARRRASRSPSAS